MLTIRSTGQWIWTDDNCAPVLSAPGYAPDSVHLGVVGVLSTKYGKIERGLFIMMEYLTKSDLKKLADLCQNRQFADEQVRDNAVDGVDYSYLERCVANREAEWMKSLSAKLYRIAESGAKRVEITI